MIQNYNEFCEELIKSGFSVGCGGNDEGTFTLDMHGWNEQLPESLLRWHTGDQEHDPWEWRIRILNERDDIAYSKMFFRKGGFVSKKWYPYFLAARRGNNDFEEAYQSGTMSIFSKKIYEVLEKNGDMAVHDIKSHCGISKEDGAKFEKALVDLQMKLFITMCGSKRKISNKGEEYGWASTSFCIVENFWKPDVFQKAERISANEAEEAVTEQVYKLNPNANAKKIKKLIYG